MVVDPALIVLFDMSGGNGRRVGAYLCALLITPCLCTKAGRHKPCTEGGGTACPPPCPHRAQEGALMGSHWWGPSGKRGEGTQTQFAFPLPLFKSPFACCVARKGGGHREWEDEVGRDAGRGVVLCHFPFTGSRDLGTK